jgi:hypothetical protein
MNNSTLAPDDYSVLGYTQNDKERLDKRLSIEDILKPGVKLKAAKLEDTEELRKMIEEVQEQQREILKLKEVDINQLRNTIINI